jgi:hypothetical protein
MDKISAQEIARIKELRRTGHSLPEIKKAVNRGTGTIFRYAHSVRVAPECAEILRFKQGGSRARSKRHWDEARIRASGLVGRLAVRDKILILGALYWGEGTKRELNIINGDANLLRVFVSCLEAIGVASSDLKFSLRLFGDINERAARVFWAAQFGVSTKDIQVSEVLTSKKRGKLPFGMCRIRLQKGGEYFKLIMSVIKSISADSCPRSSMDRTAAS